MAYGKWDKKSRDLSGYIANCMNYAKSRIMRQTPKSSMDVSGIGEAEAKNKARSASNRPSGSRTVPGMPDKLR